MSCEAEGSALCGFKEATKYVVKNTQSPMENTNNAGLRKMKREICPSRDFLEIQQLRRHAVNAVGLNSIPSQVTRSGMLHKMQCSQINKEK